MPFAERLLFRKQLQEQKGIPSHMQQYLMAGEKDEYVRRLQGDDPNEIKENLIAQLTAPVRWTQCIQAMIADGGTDFVEVGPGKVLVGLMRKIDRSVLASSAVIEF